MAEFTIKMNLIVFIMDKFIKEIIPILGLIKKISGIMILINKE